MLDTHREVASHKGYTIYQRQPGFEFTPVMLAKIASYIVQNDDGQWTVYAFMYSLLSKLDNPYIEEDSLLSAAVGTIQESIDSGEFRHRTERTYEYRYGVFIEAINPRWWITTHT
ncbi:hypothetical protein BH23CHL2_BH23CHL2_21020 [soil metagenome]